MEQERRKMRENENIKEKSDIDAVNECLDFILKGKYWDAVKLLYRCDTKPVAKLKELCMNLFFTDAYFRRIADGYITDAVYLDTSPNSEAVKRLHFTLFKMLFWMRRVAEGDYSEIPEDIGELSDVFNHMVRSIAGKAESGDVLPLVK